MESRPENTPRSHIITIGLSCMLFYAVARDIAFDCRSDSHIIAHQTHTGLCQHRIRYNMREPREFGRLQAL